MEIKHQGLKSSVYFGIIIFSFFSILFNLLSFKELKLKFLISILPILTFIQIFNFGILNILFSASSWKTQTIIYQNKLDDSKKVEFQMLDIGFAGYEERTIEVNYITNWFYISSPFTEGMYNSDWVRIEKEVNELGLK
ncbi:MAG: hypothetical protein V4666_09360 [Bacteroidota bacterium]